MATLRPSLDLSLAVGSSLSLIRYQLMSYRSPVVRLLLREKIQWLQYLPALQTHWPLLVHSGYQRSSSRGVHCRYGPTAPRSRLPNQPRDQRGVTQLCGFHRSGLARGAPIFGVSHQRLNSSISILGLTRRHRSAYYILCLSFPFPTRTDEEDRAAWAIVGHGDESPSTCTSTSAGAGTEKAV